MATNKKLSEEKEIQLTQKIIMESEDIKNYSVSDKYKVGEMIYHPVFDETGKVLRKMKSHSGKYKKIIVKFKKVGQKTLIEGFEDT